MSGEKTTDWDALRSFMPMSFGKQAKTNDLSQEFEKTKREVRSNCLACILFLTNFLGSNRKKEGMCRDSRRTSESSSDRSRSRSRR